MTAVSPEKRAEIQAHLDAIEAEHGVHVLFACESGSRAWGFASPDSDYDVRFIYSHPRDWYLTIEAGRDVIEIPIDDEMDISGWDLRKAVGLLRSGNATVIEWFDSPIVYREAGGFADEVRALGAASTRTAPSAPLRVRVPRLWASVNRKGAQGDAHDEGDPDASSRLRPARIGLSGDTRAVAPACHRQVDRGGRDEHRKRQWGPSLQTR